MNITRFIKEELGIKPDDVLIVKMDIEQWEWPILAGTQGELGGIGICKINVKVNNFRNAIVKPMCSSKET